MNVLYLLGRRPRHIETGFSSFVSQFFPSLGRRLNDSRLRADVLLARRVSEVAVLPTTGSRLPHCNTVLI